LASVLFRTDLSVGCLRAPEKTVAYRRYVPSLCPDCLLPMRGAPSGRFHPIATSDIDAALASQRLGRALGCALYQLIMDEVAEQQAQFCRQRPGAFVEPFVIQQYVPYFELPRAASRRITVRRSGCAHAAGLAVHILQPAQLRPQRLA